MSLASYTHRKKLTSEEVTNVGILREAGFNSNTHRNNSIPILFPGKTIETMDTLNADEQEAFVMMMIATSQTVDPNRIMHVVEPMLTSDAAKRIIENWFANGKIAKKNDQVARNAMTLIRLRAAWTEHVAYGAALNGGLKSRYLPIVLHLNGRNYNLLIPHALAFAGSHQLALDPTMNGLAVAYQVHYWLNVVRATAEVDNGPKFVWKYTENGFHDDRKLVVPDESQTAVHEDFTGNVDLRGLMIYQKYALSTVMEDSIGINKMYPEIPPYNTWIKEDENGEMKVLDPKAVDVNKKNSEILNEGVKATYLIHELLRNIDIRQDFAQDGRPMGNFSNSPDYNPERSKGTAVATNSTDAAAANRNDEKDALFLKTLIEIQKNFNAGTSISAPVTTGASNNAVNREVSTANVTEERVPCPIKVVGLYKRIKRDNPDFSKEECVDAAIEEYNAGVWFGKISAPVEGQIGVKMV